MADTKDIQAKLDEAQDDLEKNISELKHVIEDKLETPKHVIEVVEAPLSFIRKHAVVLGVAAVFAIGLLVGRARRVRQS
ncbi:MAG TPA: hypothetical protein VF403_21165 [Kofleriaceae bacterium]